MSVAMAVQNALRGVPLRAGDDGLVMRRLVVLVLPVAVLHRAVIVKVRRPGLSRKHVAAVALIAHDRRHARRAP